MNHRILQWIMGVAIVILFGYTWLAHQFGSKSESIQQGAAAQNFKLKTLDGHELSLADYQGKGVILNFWGTFCNPCKEEMPALESRYQKYKEQVVVIGVDASEPVNVVSNFIKERGITFPIVLDPGLETANAYQVNELPYSVFIKPDGRLSHINIGQMDEQTIEKYVKSILPK